MGETIKVFVTYSWDGKTNHKVYSFVDFLRKNGFNAECDKNRMQRETASSFTRIMSEGLQNSKIIVILSESYKKKAEAFKGGVGKEYKIISEDIDDNKNKYIFASFNGVTAEIRNKIVPGMYKTHEIVDLIEDEKNGFNNLFAKLKDVSPINFSPVSSKTPEILQTTPGAFTLKENDTSDTEQETSSKPRFPGQLPFNNLPYTRNPHFTGRKEILESMCASFESGEYTALTQSVAGLGGVGKTQLVLEYAFAYAHLYDTIWWVEAETFETMLKAYTDFVHRLGIVDKSVVNKDVIVEGVWHWMSQNAKWLFVFDNAESPESIADFLPRNNTGNILVTSRYTGWTSYAKEITINEFTPDEAADFLLERTKIYDMANAKLLAAQLGYLPLALEQAAAYIINNETDYEEYLSLYDTYRLKLFDEDCNPKDYDKTVTITWNVSIDKIDKESARQLLNICAYLAADSIPKKMFVCAAQTLPEPLAGELQDDLAYNSVIRELTKYSLIKKQGSGYSIHRLLQEVVWQSLDGRQWLGHCLGMLKVVYAFDEQDVKSWDTFPQYAPHALAVVQHAVMMNFELEEAARIYNRTGFWFLHIGAFRQAEQVLQKAVQLFEKVLGREHPKTATTYNNMAGVYYSQGEYDKALEWYEKALEIREKVLGKNHPDTATTYNNMASVYRRQGKYDKALDWYEKALRIKEKALGKEHPDTATTYNNMALVYGRQGEYDKALVWYVKALKVFIKRGMTEHPNAAATFGNLHAAYIESGGKEEDFEGWLENKLED